MKILHLAILLVGSAATVGTYFLFGIALNNSYTTLAARFSQSFFNIFTFIPFSIIGLGCAILVWCVFLHKFEIMRKQVIVFSILVMVVGVDVFGFYLLD
ncbi:membrane protein of unknown function [Nitrosotalea devaniterrae]|uniref:Uncharacterized protein n=1 Tax=Nitrosotalea devaniterrae TaxID=1078905 RepID=A0A128A222_9ARCH|nr:membrane protein of unknown function [Candidatus Nitrosotalea devanaterra]